MLTKELKGEDLRPVGRFNESTNRVEPVSDNAPLPVSLSSSVSSITILTASGTESSSGDTEVVAAVAGSKIVVLGYAFTTVSSTKDRLLLKSGGSTEIWRPAILQSVGDVTTGANLIVAPPGQICETAVGEALNINKGAAVETDWSITYYTV